VYCLVSSEQPGIKQSYLSSNPCYAIVMKSPSSHFPGAVLIVFLITAFFAGCVATTPSAVPPSNHDTELLSIGTESGKALGPAISKVSEDASEKDIASLGDDSARLSLLAGEYYFRMRDLNVSPKYQAWKTNYLLGLLDLQTAGDYFSKSAAAARSEDYTTALTYLEQGNTLFQRSNHYLNMANESIRE
jgi:hypothetical protein